MKFAYASPAPALTRFALAARGEDNVWVANFGPLEQGNNFTGRLTKLWGINAPQGHNVGDPISPRTGYTVPSAGSEVLLHNGDEPFAKMLARARESFPTKHLHAHESKPESAHAFAKLSYARGS